MKRIVLLIIIIVSSYASFGQQLSVQSYKINRVSRLLTKEIKKDDSIFDQKNIVVYTISDSISRSSILDKDIFLNKLNMHLNRKLRQHISIFDDRKKTGKLPHIDFYLWYKGSFDVSKRLNVELYLQNTESKQKYSYAASISVISYEPLWYSAFLPGLGQVLYDKKILGYSTIFLATAFLTSTVVSYKLYDYYFDKANACINVNIGCYEYNRDLYQKYYTGFMASAWALGITYTLNIVSTYWTTIAYNKGIDEELSADNMKFYPNILDYGMGKKTYGLTFIYKF